MTVHSYLRISTLGKGQTVENQRLAIQSSGFATDIWYEEEGVSGTVPALKRPKFMEMIASMKGGDLLVTTALDRLGRNANDIHITTKTLEDMGVRVCILSMGSVDITSLYGKAFVQILSALAELERGVIQERVLMGLERTKKEGTILGRALTITPNVLRELCEKRLQKVPLKKLSEDYKLDIMTIQRNTKKWEDKLEEYEDFYNKQQKQVKTNNLKRAK